MIDYEVIREVVTNVVIIFSCVAFPYVTIDVIRILQKVSFFTYFKDFNVRKDEIK